uniref:MORC family CW-type zinc finger 4 n=1 Tax=Anser brachyrhynchus TaxID=132585 RepID=A0A8B9BAA1_9AVES
GDFQGHAARLRAWRGSAASRAGCLRGTDLEVTCRSYLEVTYRPLPLWRPWLPREEEEATGRRRGRTDAAQPRDVAEASRDGNPSKAPALFHHPVRLLWPRSKTFDYLYGVGERLLRNFPVQATLCLYDDSGSEDEDEEEEEEDEEDNDEEDAEEGEGKAGGAVPAVGAGSLLPAAGSARPV